ncbi:hypothetical protein CR513_08145, partial [Mucuna pruriens]
MVYDQAGQERKLQLQEELHLEPYENSRIYKVKVKQFHDNQILRKKFRVSQKAPAGIISQWSNANDGRGGEHLTTRPGHTR